MDEINSVCFTEFDIIDILFCNISIIIDYRFNKYKVICTICMVKFSIITCFYPKNRHTKDHHLIFKDKESIPSVFNHTSVIGDEMKISYTVRLNLEFESLLSGHHVKKMRNF